MLTTLVGSRPGRRLGLFVCGLLFPALAAADGALQLQSPDGRRQVGAVEARAPMTIDGALDEEAWRTAQPAGDFVQAEPHEGEPASELTEVRIAYDRDALYIGVVCHDTPPAALVVNDIRKDFADRRAGQLRADPRHLRRSPQRVRVRGQSRRREIRHANRQRRARRQHQLGRRVGRGDDAAARTGGRRRSGFRSRRCASSAAPIASGA